MELEFLNSENILSPEEVDNMFLEDNEEKQESPTEPQGENKEEQKKEEQKTTEVKAEELFAEPESVGSESDDSQESEEDAKSNKANSSQKNFFSSIAEALVDEGIFPDLDDNTISNIKSPEDFKDMIEAQIKAGLDAKQQRVNEALDAGLESNTIKQYEGAIDYLDSISDEIISEEGNKGEELRKQLIYQDYINRGFSKQRASREVQKSIENGTDIEDAKDALQSNKEFFKAQYDDAVNQGKEAQKAQMENLKKQAEELKTSILNDKNFFGDLAVDNKTRQTIFDNISKPTYKDPESGRLLTAIQKYEKEHKVEFLKNLSLVFTLTDGFKNIDGLVKNKVRKETKKSLRELEHTINNTSRNADGSFRFMSGSGGDDSFSDKWELDI